MAWGLAEQDAEKRGYNAGVTGYEAVEVTGTLVVGQGSLAITAENVDTFTF